MSLYPSFNLLTEKAITIYLSDEIGEEIHQQVLSFKNQLDLEKWPWLLEVVPSYNSITVFVEISFYQSHVSLVSFFQNYFKTVSLLEKFVSPSEVKNIPVIYDGEDLDFVAEYSKLSPSEVIKIHSSAQYTVAMIGFLPGFPYLIGMPSELFVPRKESPGLKVEKGSVGLAGIQTGIYPFESPGGWQIIGKTSIELFNIENLNYLKIGDKVKFSPVYL